MPLHRRMQIENLNKKLWPRVQNKLKKRRWMELCLAVGLAKHSSGALLLCDGRENCGCDRLRRCYCCSSTISKSITQRKKIYNPSIWPLWKMIQFDQSIEKKQFKCCLKEEGLLCEEQRASMWKSIITDCLPASLYVQQTKQGWLRTEQNAHLVGLVSNSNWETSSLRHSKILFLLISANKNKWIYSLHLI